jgi:hypothetical protein
MSGIRIAADVRVDSCPDASVHIIAAHRIPLPAALTTELTEDEDRIARIDAPLPEKDVLHGNRIEEEEGVARFVSLPVPGTWRQESYSKFCPIARI